MNKTRSFQLEVVENEMAAILREKNPTQRLAVAFGLWRSASRMLHCMLRSQYPDWEAERISAEVARRLSHGAI